jgi:phosphatidylinositol alpha-1,6-mannosyltransferase
MPTTLIITNDFPPRVGGIESFMADVVELLDRDVAVFTAADRGPLRRGPSRGIEVGRASEVRPGIPVGPGIQIVRAGRVLLPTPAMTLAAVDLFRRVGASRVLFGAAAPLGLMAASLRAVGAERIVALSHGHETWWATVPGSRSLLRRLGDDVDNLATISDYTAGRIAPALSVEARGRMIRLSPPVDSTAFRPADGLNRNGDRPRVIAVGRLVRQKGFDTLLRGWRLVCDRWPGPGPRPELVLVGDGPQYRALEAMVAGLGLSSTVRMRGALPRRDVIAELQRADLFALPVRTRLAGLNPEGLGLAAIEAAACGLPVIVGDSGGAPETVRHGRTGFVVDPGHEQQLADRIVTLLTNPGLARSMGMAGREFVTTKFGAERARATLRTALGVA